MQVSDPAVGGTYMVIIDMINNVLELLYWNAFHVKGGFRK